MEFNVGDIIKHRVFGKGEVLSCDNSVYLIDFGKFGKRSIDSKYLGMELIKRGKRQESNGKDNIYLLTKILRYLRKNYISKIYYDDLIKDVNLVIDIPNKDTFKKLVCINNDDWVITSDLLDYLINFYNTNIPKNVEKTAASQTLSNNLIRVEEQRESLLPQSKNNPIQSNANFNLVRAHSKDFDKDYYSSKFFFNKLRNIGVDDSYFKKAIFFLDYTAYKNYVIKSKFKNLEDCILHDIGQKDLYYYNNEFDLKEYDDAIENLINELYLVKEDNGLYSTFNMLKKSGIDGNEVLTFKAKLIDFSYKHKIFSFNQLYENFSDSKLVSYCNTAEKLLPFIGKIDEISYFVTLSGDFIFGRVKTNLIKELFRSILKDQTSKDIYDIISTITTKFNVEYTLEDFERDITKTDYYYAKTLEKIFKNKKLYYEEIYN